MQCCMSTAFLIVGCKVTLWIPVASSKHLQCKPKWTTRQKGQQSHDVTVNILQKALKKKRKESKKETWMTAMQMHDHNYSHTLHTVSFDWFLSGLEWILNLEFCLLKLLIFYQKILWNIRSRLNSSTFWVFEPVFKYIWSKSSFIVHKASILIKHI